MENKSFTLIELLVVIVIIGILAGVIIVSVSSSINKANFAKAQSFSNTVQNELLGDLVSEWTFNSPAVANITEDSWGNNDGTVSGATYKTKADGVCVYGGCYEFDGIDDYIDYGNVLITDRVNSRTYSVWVKPKIQTWRAIFSLGNLTHSKNGYSIFGILSPSIIRVSYDFNVTPYVADVNCSTDLDEWNYLNFVVDISDSINTVIKIYKNGVYSDSTTQVRCTGGRINTSFIIGATTTGATDLKSGFFKGLVDDVRVYEEALSSSQIKQQYIAGLDSLLSKNIISQEDYDQRLNNLAQN